MNLGVKVVFAVAVSTVAFTTTVWSQVGLKADAIHRLTCPKLDYILGFTPGLGRAPAPDVRIICNRAASLCHAQKMVFQEKKTDPLRKEVEGWLGKQIRYELDLCEVAIRHYDATFLNEQEPR